MKIAETGAPPFKELTPKKETRHVSHLLLDWSDPYSSFTLVHLEGKTLLVHTPFLACVSFLCCQGFLDILANSGYRNMWKVNVAARLVEIPKVGGIGSGEGGAIKA